MIALLIAATATAATATTQQPTAQQKEAARNATREQLRKLLEITGAQKGVNVAFRQSEKQPFNFMGVMRTGLVNADSMEIIISVTNNDTIGFRIYPHYKNGYINLDKAKNSVGLMRQLLNLSDRNFLFWGADNTADLFAGYTFTLESGFPDKAVDVVLYSISSLDKFVGDMRPSIDGTAAAPASAPATPAAQLH